MKKVSFVIPCYRSEHTLPHVVKEIREKMQELTQYEYDIFLVNDASPDNTMGTIRDLCDKYENIKGIGFARNFGQHAALMAGLRHSDGDYVVCLDDDGQTPADEVDKLLGKLEEGFDAVYASYEHKQHSAFRNMGSKVNELMTRMVLRATKNITNVAVCHREREEGSSGYTLKKLLGLWFNGFTAFSVKPLRIATTLGVGCAGMGFLYGIYTIIKRLVNPNVPMGFSALMAAVVFFGGMIMIMLGLIGEYVGRIYISMNNSPQYVIREKIHLGEEDR